jgi:hypothetical protein
MSSKSIGSYKYSSNVRRESASESEFGGRRKNGYIIIFIFLKFKSFFNLKSNKEVATEVEIDEHIMMKMKIIQNKVAQMTQNQIIIMRKII